MIEFNSLRDIQKFTADKNNAITDGFTRIPKYGEFGHILNISLQEYGLLCILYEYLNTITGKCYPTQAALLSRVKVSKRSIQVYLHNLESAGFIRRIPAIKKTKAGNYDFTSSEIIIVPIDYVRDPLYHSAIDKFLDENRYVLVNYTGKSRNAVGTGKNNTVVSRKSDIQINNSKPVIDRTIMPVNEPELQIISKPNEPAVNIESHIKGVSVDGQVIQPSCYIESAPIRKKTAVTEDELQQARTDFQVLREIPGLPNNVDIEKEIDKALAIVKRVGYKPGYEIYMREKLDKLMKNPYYSTKPMEIVLILQSDYCIIWNRTI